MKNLFIFLFMSLSCFLVLKENVYATESVKEQSGTANKTSGEKEIDSKTQSALNMFSDLYVDCLKAANFSRYYVSDKLLTPEEADKMCGTIMDKAQEALAFSAFSMEQIKSILEDTKAKAFELFQKEQKAEQLKENKNQDKSGIENKSSGEKEIDPKTQSALNVFSDLYVDCLKVANFSRYYVSDKLLTPEEADKICGTIMDNAQEVLVFSAFSMEQIKNILEDTKAKAFELFQKEQKAEQLKESGEKTNNSTKDDTVTL
ncbi:hypothetical protein [Desulfovibrio litoralis]|nr:hypothetical protein [Desulfovibrio litoralis]